MPGLVGAIDFSGQARTDEIVAEACDILNRKGWYKVCKRSFGAKLTIARVHLDIFNREPQPVCDRRGKIFAFLEGEIYLPDGPDDQGSNAQIEHVLQLYQERGIDFASALNGSFVAAIYDSAKDLLIISTDRIASRPLFYAKTATAFYFSPEIKAILPNSDVNKNLDEVALASFLTNGYPIGDRTFFEDIKILKPATTMTIDIKTGSINQHTYWGYLFDENADDKGTDYYVRELSRLLRRAVKRAIGGGQRIVVLLSGGVDSRGILGSCLEELPEINAVTWGETSDKKNSDAVIAREICRRFKVNHRFYRLDPSKLVDHAKEWVYETEAATDQLGNYPGGLEVFEDLRRDFDLMLRGDQSYVVSLLLQQSLDEQLARILRPETYQKFKKQYKEEIDKVFGEFGLKNYNNRKDYLFYYQELFRWVNPVSYYKQKRIEQRNPLLDSDILDFLLQLPQKHRANKRLYTKTLANTFPELMKVGFAKVGNLPDWGKQFQQNKKLQDFVTKTLIQERKEDGFFELFDPDKLEAFVKSCLQNKPSPLKLKGKLFSSVRSSRLWSSRFGIYIRKQVRYRIMKGQISATPNDTMLMRLLILKLWYDQFCPTSGIERAK